MKKRIKESVDKNNELFKSVKTETEEDLLKNAINMDNYADKNLEREYLM